MLVLRCMCSLSQRRFPSAPPRSQQAGQGSGLGLYIARGIVMQHGGTLEASSPGKGHGSTFTATLPLFHVSDTLLPANLRYLSNQTDEEEAQGSGEILAVSLSILVVDDSMANRKLLQRLLERRGHSCVTASDGVEAVDRVKESLAENKPFDTVLLDYEMPQVRFSAFILNFSARLIESHDLPPYLLPKRMDREF